MNSITIHALWSDIDVVLLRVTVNGGAFSGSTEIYTTDEILREAAEQVSGFPSNVNDRRVFGLSTTTENIADFELRCISNAGQAVMIARVENQSSIVPETATIVFSVFPTSLDAFGRALHAMAKRTITDAVLGD